MDLAFRWTRGVVAFLAVITVLVLPRVVAAAEPKTIYLAVKASSWRDQPFDVAREARSRLEQGGFKVVLEERAAHEAVVTIEWTEKPGGNFQDVSSNVLGTGTTITCRIEITARSTGRSVAYDGLSAPTPTVIGDIRPDTARDDLRDGAAHAMLKESPWLTLGATVAQELAVLAR